MKIKLVVQVTDGDRSTRVAFDTDVSSYGRDPIIGTIDRAFDGARKVIAETLAPRGRPS